MPLSIYCYQGQDMCKCFLLESTNFVGDKPTGKKKSQKEKMGSTQEKKITSSRMKHVYTNQYFK